MAKKNREHSLHYLNQEYGAMRWLAKQGLTPEEIREFRWGQVDETTRTITVRTKVFHIRYDKESGLAHRMEDFKEVKIPVKGSGHEWFFLESKTPSPIWTFTAHTPRSWRKEAGREALFPLEEVERCCRDLEIHKPNVLTFIDARGNMEISKLNIQSQESVERIEEAEITTEAND